jgi:hypothetical protein
MLTRRNAQLLVDNQLDTWNCNLSDLEQFVVLDDETIERPWGWVFFFTTRGWLSGDERYLVAGNGPILVNRHTSEVRHLLTARSIAVQLAEYETEMSLGK